MKKSLRIVLGILAVAAVLVTAHLLVNTNWPELVKAVHGR